MVTRLAIIDDDPLVRAGLRLILGADPAMQVVAEATDGDGAVDLVREHRPDVVLMDIRMPRVNGLVATERVVALPDPPRVIILTTFDADDMVLKALSVGASGFLLKDTPPERMLEDIRKVADGEPTLSPSVAAQVIAVATNRAELGRRESARAALDALTERERAVALDIGQGRTNAQIAGAHYLSVATVKAHVTRILEKLGATNRVQVAIIVHDADVD
ncbi:two component transcriptional regulator, LuxR family [Tessaracoccus bendigoensis DSM 12906]|uniref:Two component transcriptional regulator, LuxR family n=1 Tax=Tessaracoccus bendigoensis DSM 12906 TaxID=1123357 RepID=A0A1M6ETP4_9ACTN|nr:two component transcriptional regulator, LuxR family [Tessaracoccus bendigoensis DSM 12906]